MSELTTCNYCTLKQIRGAWKAQFSWERMNAKKGDRIYLRRVTDFHGHKWINVFRVHKGDRLDTSVDKKGNHGKQFMCAFAGLSDHCVC